MTYQVDVQAPAKRSLLSLDAPLRDRIIKKLVQLARDDLQSRHLSHGVPHFVEEVAGYRITFTKDDTKKIKKVWFIGDHKEYEKWYRSADR